MIRVVVADDQPLFRGGVVRLLELADDMVVVAEAGDGREAVEAVVRHRPDVVLMDLQMPVLDGVQATEQIRQVRPQTAVVVLTTFSRDEYLLPALRAGASGYLLKDATLEDLQRGVRAAASGQAVLAPQVARRLIDVVTPNLPQHDPEVQEKIGRLTEREREVLAYVAVGMSNQEIAHALYLAEPTVKAALTRAMARIGATNRTQAALIAHRAGLQSPEQTEGPR